MALRRVGWAGVWVCACSSSNPAFDPPRAADTGSTVDTTTGVVDDDGSGSTGDPTVDGGALPIPGTCEAARLDRGPVKFRLTPAAGDMEIRRCDEVLVLSECSIANTEERGWTLTGCTTSGTGPDGPLPVSMDLEIDPPPDQQVGTVFAGDVYVSYASADEGCGFEWGFIKWDELQMETLVWAGTNELDPGSPYPIAADATGPWNDTCECGPDVAACNPNYGPQILYMCYEGWLCTDVAPDGEESILDIPMVGLQYGAIILEAFEPESEADEGEYHHVVRLSTQILPPG